MITLPKKLGSIQQEAKEYKSQKARCVKHSCEGETGLIPGVNDDNDGFQKR